MSLLETIGVADGDIGLGIDGPSFELGDERCEPADCVVGTLESVRPDIVGTVLFSSSSAGAACLDDRGNGDVGGKELDNIGQQATGPLKPEVSLRLGKYWRMWDF